MEPTKMWLNEKEIRAMPKRKWDAKTKTLIVLEGLKGRPVADLCAEHAREPRPVLPVARPVSGPRTARLRKPCRRGADRAVGSRNPAAQRAGGLFCRWN